MVWLSSNVTASRRARAPTPSRSSCSSIRTTLGDGGGDGVTTGIELSNITTGSSALRPENFDQSDVQNKIVPAKRSPQAFFPMQDSNSRHKPFEAQIHEILVLNLTDRAATPSAAHGCVSLEAGLIFPGGIVKDLPLTIEPLPPVGIVVDGAGHTRPVYAALLVYAWLRAAERGGFPAELIRPWCEMLEFNLAKLSPATDAAGIAWNALALRVAAEPLGRADWRKLASETFGRFARAQQADGALLAPAPGINPETRWYDELVLLHAMRSYAVETGDPEIAAAVRRAAEFNMMEMQPDHATQQPWALFAFHSNPQTRIQAEEILHTAIMHGRTNLDAISLILLADALWCLRSG